MKKLILCCGLSLLSIIGYAQEPLRLMFYNLFEYPQNLPVYRAPILKRILTENDPDLFLVCELLNEEGADNILLHSLDYHPTKVFKRVPFIPNQSNSDSEMQQLAFYNSHKLELLTTEVFPTPHRDINKYKFRLLFEDENADNVFLYAFVAHLKSSPGRANRLQRYEMAKIVTQQLDYIEANAYIVFAGDFNLYNADEEAYIELMNPENTRVFFDPINEPGDWHENIAFQHVHTQATRESNLGFTTGASGGMDDRFDFIILSENLQDTSANLYYLQDTYKAYGNNGNCYKKSINDPTCTGIYTAQQREDLYWMSDHLPIVLDLESQHNFLNLEKTEHPIPSINLLENPITNAELKLEIPEALLGLRMKLKVSNTLGKVFWKTDILVENTYLSLPLSDLADGIYILQIYHKNYENLKILIHNH